MKGVILFGLVLFIGLNTSAQSTSSNVERSVVSKSSKIKKQKSKVVANKDAADEKNVTTLSDEHSYKAKSRFEQMLMRRIELDAAEAPKQKQ